MVGDEGSRSLEAPVPEKFRAKDAAAAPGRQIGSAVNWTLCLLCLTSLAISGLLAFREFRLEERIAHLERQLLQLHQKQAEPSELLVKRIREEVQLQVEGAQWRLAETGAVPSTFRRKRDAECNCPPGSVALCSPLSGRARSTVRPLGVFPFRASRAPGTGCQGVRRRTAALRDRGLGLLSSIF